jgi:putative endonuclease
MYYVYMLKSKKSGKYYIGYTDNIKARFDSHNKGLNKATKPYIPWVLEYYEAYKTEDAALTREKILKNHGRTLAALKSRSATGRTI